MPLFSKKKKWNIEFLINFSNILDKQIKKKNRSIISQPTECSLFPALKMGKAGFKIEVLKLVLKPRKCMGGHCLADCLFDRPSFLDPDKV